MDDRSAFTWDLRNGQFPEIAPDDAGACGWHAVSGAKHRTHGSTLSEMSFDPERNAVALTQSCAGIPRSLY
jgi:hypothetical protein